MGSKDQGGEGRGSTGSTSGGKGDCDALEPQITIRASRAAACFLVDQTAVFVGRNTEGPVTKQRFQRGTWRVGHRQGATISECYAFACQTCKEKARFLEVGVWRLRELGGAIAAAASAGSTSVRPATEGWNRQERTGAPAVPRARAMTSRATELGQAWAVTIIAHETGALGSFAGKNYPGRARETVAQSQGQARVSRPGVLPSLGATSTQNLGKQRANRGQVLRYKRTSVCGVK